jgi:hypothetical protein
MWSNFSLGERTSPRAASRSPSRAPPMSPPSSPALVKLQTLHLPSLRSPIPPSRLPPPSPPWQTATVATTPALHHCRAPPFFSHPPRSPILATRSPSATDLCPLARADLTGALLSCLVHPPCPPPAPSSRWRRTTSLRLAPRPCLGQLARLARELHRRRQGPMFLLRFGFEVLVD